MPSKPRHDTRRSNGRLHLLLINPVNELVAITNTEDNAWNEGRIWKPLGLLVLAGRTPPEWEVEVIDENLGAPDYEAMPLPDLVGISAFTSQANAAYALAARFRRRGVKVMMGGVHATMCTEEALEHVDTVVTGEADDVWEGVLADARRGTLQRLYHGGYADMSKVRPARHDLASSGYLFGSLQVSRGCPLDCSFCSVTAFNGRRVRRRPIPEVVEELTRIREPLVLIVDDNLIGTSKRQIAYSKDLFRAMAKTRHGKAWMGQVTINFADDEELLELAFKAGCFGVLIGFESPTVEGLGELDKTFNIRHGRDLRESVRRIHRHHLIVAGSFALGLDVDRVGIGREIAAAGHRYGLDVVNTLFLTPLPGTRLFTQLQAEGRLVADNFPSDWRYYTLTYPVSRYKHLDWQEAAREMHEVNCSFYNFPRILQRFSRAIWRIGNPIGAVVSLTTNLSYRFNRSLDATALASARPTPASVPLEGRPAPRVILPRVVARQGTTWSAPAIPAPAD
jgi:radical SAM superfamily enzyme YgiQ (UPF0313 family)